MAMSNFSIHVEAKDFRSFFMELLKEIGFIIIHQEVKEDGFTIIGSNAKRTSQLNITLMNLFIGYINKNRIAIELTAKQKGEYTNATLWCKPYLDVLDIEAPDEDPRERERCLRLFNIFTERIKEKFKLVN